MSKFAVGFVNFYDNVLQIEIVESQDWRSAAVKHSMGFWESVEDIPETLEDAKEAAFDADGAFDCVEIL